MAIPAKKLDQATLDIPSSSSIKVHDAEAAESIESEEQEPAYLGDKIACTILLGSALLLAGKVLIDFLVGILR
jgi:hypothetical protein